MSRPPSPSPAPSPAEPLTLEQFLAAADQFRLGRLPTEQSHPKTRDLAAWARDDLPRGVAALLEVDVDALKVLTERAGAVERLTAAVQATLAGGGRVFLCGCGATGRLALSLETLWRQRHASSPRADRVVALMAGGDTALVSSIEGFEDHPRLGARHLADLGFGSGDLLVSCTEGGETAWVLGATQHAGRVSARRPWLLYCNPDDSLRGIERSRRAIDDPGIACLPIPTGPMALSGSTRMQASTVLMLAVGLALLEPEDDPVERLEVLAGRIEGIDTERLSALVEAESGLYESGGYLLYEAERHAITVLTDTTERSPTFNLASFENIGDAAPEPSLCYLLIASARDASSAWRTLLARPPRPLDWPGFEAAAGRERLLGFDFSPAIIARRRALSNGAPHERMRVAGDGRLLRLSLAGVELSLPVASLRVLEEHVLLKLVLNAHSTLVMGRLGRYEGNVMTWVRPSNRKLIDRAIRYADHLLRERHGVALSYETLARGLFAAMEGLSSARSIVLDTVARALRSA